MIEQIEQFKQKMPKSKVALLQKVHAVQTALVETLQERDNKIELKLLIEKSYYNEQKERVLNPKYSWTITDVEYENFLALKTLEMKKQGFAHPKADEGISTTLVAENNLRKLNNKIFNFVCEALPDDVSNTFKKAPWKCQDKIVTMFLKLEV